MVCLTANATVTGYGPTPIRPVSETTAMLNVGRRWEAKLRSRRTNQKRSPDLRRVYGIGGSNKLIGSKVRIDGRG
jgi:hypothetical protein